MLQSSSCTCGFGDTSSIPDYPDGEVRFLFPTHWALSRCSSCAPGEGFRSLFSPIKRRHSLEVRVCAIVIFLCPSDGAGRSSPPPSRTDDPSSLTRSWLPPLPSHLGALFCCHLPPRCPPSPPFLEVPALMTTNIVSPEVSPLLHRGVRFLAPIGTGS